MRKVQEYPKIMSREEVEDENKENIETVIQEWIIKVRKREKR